MLPSSSPSSTPTTVSQPTYLSHPPVCPTTLLNYEEPTSAAVSVVSISSIQVYRHARSTHRQHVAAHLFLSLLHKHLSPPHSVTPPCDNIITTISFISLSQNTKRRYTHSQQHHGQQLLQYEYGMQSRPLFCTWLVNHRDGMFTTSPQALLQQQNNLKKFFNTSVVCATN